MKEKKLDFLTELQNIIERRKKDMPAQSYTAGLFKMGMNKIVQKVGEEAVELIIEAKDNNIERLLNESADLLYHVMVMLTARGVRIEDVVHVLQERHK